MDVTYLDNGKCLIDVNNEIKAENLLFNGYLKYDELSSDDVIKTIEFSPNLKEETEKIDDVIKTVEFSSNLKEETEKIYDTFNPNWHFDKENNKFFYERQDFHSSTDKCVPIMLSGLFLGVILLRIIGLYSDY